MTEKDQLSNFDKSVTSASTGKLSAVEIYDKFGAMAYGIVLQIIPQPQLAQEILADVFSSPLLLTCNSYPFSYAACVIKLARAKAVEAKRRAMMLSSQDSASADIEEATPQHIFELAFCNGYSPDEVADKLSISKLEVLKALHNFFKTQRSA